MLTDHKIPLGEYIAAFVDWLTQHGASTFDAIASTLEAIIHGFTAGLTWFNPLAQVLFATLVCVIIGVPLGIVAAHKPMFYTMMRPVLDLMQTVPTFVYLIPTLTLFGLGVVPGLISTVVFAIAAPIRLTYLGIRDVPQELMDAGKAFGCSRRQLLSRIELPHAMPSIAAGITQCIMLSLSMVVIAALVGADGLGKPVVNALNTADIALGFEAGLAIVLLAIMLDRICKQPDVKIGGKV
ncbi:choline ABC transporter permease subunit [Pseudomonas putida]|nr:choline ABC transporter permease subunit [Pseudomonas putida]